MQRATPAFNLIRAFCIREFARQGKTTEEIANIFQVDRSFIIKQATIVLKPRTDKERVILKVARALATTSRVLHGPVFVDLLTGEDIKTPLAGVKTPQKGAKNPPKTPVSRGGKAYRNTPKTPRAGRPTMPPADPKSIERVKKRLEKPNALATPKPRKPRLKVAAPQEPLDTRK
jgi:hypothetical protein